MDIYQMRGWIKIAYPSEKWKKLVDKMPEEQVVAIFYRLLNSGKIKIK